MRKVADDVLQPQRHRIDSQHPRGLIHRALDRQDRLGPACTPVRINRDRIRIHPRRGQRAHRHLVDAGQDLDEKLGLDRLTELRVIGAKVGHQINLVGGDPVVGVKAKLGPRDQVTPGIVGQHGLGPGRDPGDRAGQPARRFGNHYIFGVGHRLHPEAATDIGVRDPDPVTRQAQHARKLIALHPDALAVHAKMQAVTVPFGKGRTGFHRGGGDAIVDDLNRNAVSGSCQRSFGSVRVTEEKVECTVLRGLGVKRRLFTRQVKDGVECVDIQ